MRTPKAILQMFLNRIPYAIVFLLPVGFIGIGGVALLAVFALLRLPTILRLGWRPLAVSAPIAGTIIVSALSAGDNPGQLASAVGLAMAYTLGLQALHAICLNHRLTGLVVAFVAGNLVLVASVVLDLLFGVTALPSGLFHSPGLHNWAGALFTLGFPLSVALAVGSSSRYRRFGSLAAIALVVGTLAALSWVGLIGLIVGATALGLHRYPRTTALIGAVLLLSVISYVQYHSLRPTRLVDLQVRDYSVSQWRYVAAERLAIASIGARLALAKPWIGWGFSVHHGSLARNPSLSETMAKLSTAEAAGPNLLRASQAVDRLPWTTLRTAVAGDSAVAPDGSMTAEHLDQVGPGRQYVYQYSPLSEGRSSHTFSLWARSDIEQGHLVLAVLDTNWRNDGFLTMGTTPVAEVIQDGTARFPLSDAWQRYSLAVDYEAPPDGLVVSFYAQVPSSASSPVSYQVWGAQLNEGSTPLPYNPTGASLPYPRLGTLAHFHNWLVQVAFENGVLGATALLVLLAWLYKNARGSLGEPVRAAMIAFGSTQLLDYATHQSTILLSFLFVTAIGYGSAQRRSPQAQDTAVVP